MCSNLPPHSINHSHIFAAYDRHQHSLCQERTLHETSRNALQSFLYGYSCSKQASDGFKRIKLCRDALEAIDRRGFQRSFHQRLFHDNFIRSCARIFWKTEPAGSFAQNHQKILEMNGWDHLSQEILVSTPRRWVTTLFSFILCFFLLLFAWLTSLEFSHLKLWHWSFACTVPFASLAHIDLIKCCIEVSLLNFLVYILSFYLCQCIHTKPLTTHTATTLRQGVHPTTSNKPIPEPPPLVSLIRANLLWQAGRRKCMTIGICGDFCGDF